MPPRNFERLFEIPREIVGIGLGRFGPGGSGSRKRLFGRGFRTLFAAGGFPRFFRRFFAGFLFGQFGDPPLDLAGDFAERLFRLLDNGVGDLLLFRAGFLLFGGDHLFGNLFFRLFGPARFLFFLRIGADRQIDRRITRFKRIEERLFNRQVFLFLYGAPPRGSGTGGALLRAAFRLRRLFGLRLGRIRIGGSRFGFVLSPPLGRKRTLGPGRFGLCFFLVQEIRLLFKR